MTDYWLSKLMFDLQREPELAATFRADRAAALARYPLKDEVKAAVLNDDVTVLAGLVNPYLLRYHFTFIRMPDAEFIRRLRAIAPASDARAPA